MNPSFYFINLGCPKNLVDAEGVAANLERWGFAQSPGLESSDLVVITTCSFIKAAMEESIEVILSAASVMEESQVLAVLGCLVSREGGKLEGLLPEVDIFLPVSRMGELPAVLKEKGLFPEVNPPSDGRSETPDRRLFTPSHIGYLKIAEGCSNRCAYCMIPSIRGGLVSRKSEDIVAESECLRERGVQELVIIAQDTGSWGHDTARGEGLFGLLRRIDEAASPPWTRLMYLHPASIDIGGLESLLRERKILRYLDIPIQHASSRILRAMGRGYDRDYLERLIGRLKSGFSDLILRTTVMVGFPGETERDFSMLVDFLERHEIDHAGVFEYSTEEGTKAYRYPGLVDEVTKNERRELIEEIQMDIFTDHFVQRTGTEETVLVDEVFPFGEGPREDVWGAGRFYGQAFEIDGVVFLSGQRKNPGEFARMRLESVQGYDIFGKVL